jgi:hypothetical protein
MKKKLMVLTMLLVMTCMACFGLAACGGSSGGSGEEVHPVSMETYEGLSDVEWADFTVDDFNKYFGTKGVVDEERTADWGKGYQVVDWYNEDESGYIHILFKDKGDGKLTAASISPMFDE